MSTTDRPVSGVEEADPDTLTILFVAVIGTLLVAIVVLVLQGLYEDVQHAEIQRKVVDQLPAELVALRVSQLEKLSGSSWVDEAHGVVRIPIEKAMVLIVREPAAAAVPPPAPSPAPIRPAESSPASTPAAGAAAVPRTKAVPSPPSRPAETSAPGASARGAASGHAASRVHP